MNVTNIWLRKTNDGFAEVLAKIDGEYKIIIKEFVGNNEIIPIFDHIATISPEASKHWEDDYIT